MRWARHVLGLIVLFTIGGVFLSLGDRLLYYPQRVTMDDVVAQSRGDGFEPWPSAEHYLGLIRTPDVPSVGTLVLFHGNAGHAGDRVWYADAFSSSGWRVVLAEYPGYGPREGALGESSLVSDARALVARVRGTFPGPLIIAGESLGAAVASATAATASADALLLITPWNDLVSVARHHYPWLPVSWLLHDRYDSVQNLQHFRGRIGVIIAERDSVIPAPFGTALFNLLPQPKRCWRVPIAEHNDWMDHVDETTWNSVIHFLRGPLETKAQTPIR
jgi:pimeloyl-ACP methyl ester carboxylesterase